MTAEAAERRLRRARIARRLAGHRNVSALADGRWQALSWGTLGSLPDWCALDDEALHELRALAGAVSLQPAIRRCLRGDVLSRLDALIGRARLEALRRRPYHVTEAPLELDAVDGLDARLATRGALALVASLEDPLARLLMHEALGTGAAEERGIGGESSTDPVAPPAAPDVGKGTAEEPLGTDRGDGTDASICAIALELRMLPGPGGPAADGLEPAGERTATAVAP